MNKFASQKYIKNVYILLFFNKLFCCCLNLFNSELYSDSNILEKIAI